MNKKQFIITVVITAAIAAIATTAFYITPIGKDIYASVMFRLGESPASKLLKIESLMDRYFMGTYNKRRMTDNAASGFVSAVNEKYTTYLTEDVYDQMQENLSGAYTGIGISFSLKNDKFVIETINENSPAQKAGLMPGDIIASVNGKEYAPSEIRSLTADIKNTPVGEKVTVGIVRDGGFCNYEIEVSNLTMDYVTHKMLSSEVGYVRIETFGNNIADTFADAVEALKKQNMKSLIIDVRSNPGGSLESVVEICDMLLPEGIITTVKDKNGKEDVYKSDSNHINVPMCVLINSESASASEILAGALKEHKKATLVGEKTYGKGVVQGVFDLNDGSGLRITIAKYFTPAGVCIDGTGIEPDEEVLLPDGATYQSLQEENASDPQLNKAVEILKSN